MAYLTYEDIDIDHSIRLDYIHGDILDKAWLKALGDKYKLTEDEKTILLQAMHSLDYLLNDGSVFRTPEILFDNVFYNYDTDEPISSTDKTKLAICEYLQADEFIHITDSTTYNTAINYLKEKGVK